MAREVVYVIARADNGVIAVNGRVPWRIKEDLRRLVAHTMGTPMIMGRKTFGVEWVEEAREERAESDEWPAHSFVTLKRRRP
jgi:dihydrofolate reductase